MDQLERAFLRLPAVASAALLAAAMAAPPVLHAQSFPAKPIRVIIPFQPGSTLDLVGHLTAAKMEEGLGQKVVVEFMGGGNGVVGAQYVARSASDGYTLLLTTPSSQITPVYLLRSVPFDPRKDFTPIVANVEPVTCLTVSPSLPVGNLKDLIELARRNPGKLSFASSGNGSVFHLMGEQVNQAAGIQIVHVPYKNAAQALPDVSGGQPEMVYSACNNVRPLAASGKLKILVQFLPAGFPGRFSRFPDLPSVTETLPNYQKPPSWIAYFGPAGTPQPVVARINAEAVKGLNAADVRPKLEEAGLFLIGNTPEQFAAMYQAGFDIYARAVKAAGLKPE
jgi:tripartite-type tricarboxylate transporter receptor subunit TctC